jgi:hypothetical protein
MMPVRPPYTAARLAAFVRSDTLRTAQSRIVIAATPVRCNLNHLQRLHRDRATCDDAIGCRADD